MNLQKTSASQPITAFAAGRTTSFCLLEHLVLSCTNKICFSLNYNETILDKKTLGLIMIQAAFEGVSSLLKVYMHSTPIDAKCTITFDQDCRTSRKLREF